MKNDFCVEEMMKTNLKLDQLVCPECHSTMYKLYWKDRVGISRDGYIFTEWYGCSDCGKHIYDKHEQCYLSQFIEKGDKDE